MKWLRNIKNILSRKKDKKLRAIAIKIGEFYLEKNKDTDTLKNFNKATEEIYSLGITQLILKRNKIIITLQRPGVLIGKRGENIDSLSKFLNMEIDIKEDNIISWILPIYMDSFDYDYL